MSVWKNTKLKIIVESVAMVTTSLKEMRPNHCALFYPVLWSVGAICGWSPTPSQPLRGFQDFSVPIRKCKKKKKKLRRNSTVIAPRKFTRKEALRFLTYVHLSATASLADPLFPWQPWLIHCLCRHGRVPMLGKDPRSSSASNHTRNFWEVGKGNPLRGELGSRSDDTIGS